MTILLEDFERKSKPVEDEIISETLIDYVFDLVINASKYEKHGLIERGPVELVEHMMKKHLEQINLKINFCLICFK
jgi:hypothetical protein